ncbi:MAG: putative baseplate assembly protein, partial [Anaerolineales bacterium]|nr:putative baseplate assembly protein [Anaerolineales bacterium]
FFLSNPQDTAVLVPAGTEVATTQTATAGSIVFTTTKDFRVTPPELKAILSKVATQKAFEKRFITHNLRHLDSGFDSVQVFSVVPQVDDALYFGFSNDLSHHVLGFSMDWDTAGGAGIDPTIPPYIWEAATPDANNRWQACDIETDTTLGLNNAGEVQLHLPQMTRYRVEGESLYWVRVRVREIGVAEQQAGMRPYQVSPELRQVTAASWGGTTPATHAQTIHNELLGKSDGTPGQSFHLRMTPILNRQKGETVVVEHQNQRTVWQETRDFAHATAVDNHFTLDSVDGTVRFGPAIRQRNGAIRLYGAVPPRGANLIFQRYRTGGGLQGNVEAHALSTLKTAIPYIDRVTNRRPAHGGLDAERLDEAIMRAPKVIRSRNRAMTAEDFEFLTNEALPSRVARVKCLQPRPSDVAQVVPGQVYVLVIPNVNYPAGYHDPEELQMRQRDLDTITTFLDERRLLTTRLNVRAPAYRWVSVSVSLGAMPGTDEGAVEKRVMERLYRFLNPLTGGPDGKGWPFGRDLFVADIYQALQGMQDVAFIRSVEIFAASPGGEKVGTAVESVDVVAHGVIASGIHEVDFVQGNV